MLGRGCCARASSSCRAGLLSSDHAQPSHCSRFFCCSSQAVRLSGCGTGPSLLHGTWDRPGPGIKAMFPALAAVLNHWTTREVPSSTCYVTTICSQLSDTAESWAGKIPAYMEYIVRLHSVLKGQKLNPNRHTRGCSWKLSW